MKFFRVAAIVCVLFAMGLASTAQALISTQISMTNFQFNPTPASRTLGQTTTWHNDTTTTAHTSTSDVAGFWDTGSVAPTTTSSGVTLSDAGTYPYHCTFHADLGMRGTIKIPVEVVTSGSVGVPFNVTWASAPIASGMNMDIQVNAPVRKGRKRHWVTKWANQTDSQEGDVFTASRKGTYKFRARLQIDSGGSSLYSPAAPITIS